VQNRPYSISYFFHKSFHPYFSIFRFTWINNGKVKRRWFRQRAEQNGKLTPNWTILQYVLILNEEFLKKLGNSSHNMYLRELIEER
jgi:hypothetical protein